MLIVADENIPFAREVFSQFGEVKTLPSSRIVPGVLRDAEMLLVRSVTKVDARLVEGSRLRFIASATIGTDHVDVDELRSRGIAFAAAPGSNARSVAEYVCAALLVLQERGALSLAGSTIGVIGVGNVGSLVVRMASALGMRVLVNDPPLELASGAAALEKLGRDSPSRFTQLEELLAASDVVTLHVPLTKGGPHPTWHMVGSNFVKRMRRGAVLVNTSRGAVCDPAALKEAVHRGLIMVIDVWEGEPRIEPELVELSALATPHIAGYSFDGKIAGTRMIYEAACRFLGVGPDWPEGLVPSHGLVVKVLRPHPLDAVRAAYDIEADDSRFRSALASDGDTSAVFEKLRREYPVRREFPNWCVELAPSARGISGQLAGLGFRVMDSVSSGGAER